MKTLFCHSNIAAASCTALLTAAVLTLAGRVEGAVTAGNILYAASMAYTDVSNAVFLSNPNGGDTVMVPAGLATWTNYLAVSNPVTLQFAGAAQSVILDNLPLVNNGNGASEAVISFTTTSKSTNIYRLTGLTIGNASTRTPSTFLKGSVQIFGTSGIVRIDNCVFTNLLNSGIYFWDAACGVIDHCSSYATNGNQHAIEIEHTSWGGALYGDGAWNPTTGASVVGTSNSVYIENDNFTGPGPGSGYALIDAFGGAHYVVRYCNITNSWITLHGTESTGNDRGARNFEVYNNVAFNTNYDYFFCARSGTGVVFSNILTGFKQCAVLADFRFVYYNYWGGITGTNYLDLNDPRNANGPFMKATVAAGTPTNSLTLQITNHWNANAYQGCTVIDEHVLLTGYMGPTNSKVNDLTVTNFGIIFSNQAWNPTTGLTVVYVKTGSPGGSSYGVLFNPGDPCVFYYPPIQAIDMTGTGVCTNVLYRVPTGSDAGDPSPPESTFPGNAVEPVYSWGNTLDGVDAPTYSQVPFIVANVHYFNDTPKPGYTPFTYPHPLTLLGSTNPPPPTILLPPSYLRVAGTP
jgi:hypothetical protein